MGEVLTAQTAPENVETPALSPEQEAELAKQEQVPEFVPEKFRSAEDPLKAMAEAYKSLEEKLGAPEEKSEDTAEGGDKKPDEQKAEEKDTVEGGDGEDEGDGNEDKFANATYGPAVDAALKAAELAPGDIAKEWAENQTLSAETYEKLNTVGYTKEVVDAYVRGFQATAADQSVQVDAAVKSIKETAGGEQAYEQMTQWAAQNLPASEVEAYNAAVSGSDVNMAKMAVAGLQARFEASEGREPSHQESGGGRPAADVFDNALQVGTAMAEARASGDPAKIKAVEQKALRSPL